MRLRSRLLVVFTVLAALLALVAALLVGGGLGTGSGTGQSDLRPGLLATPTPGAADPGFGVFRQSQPAAVEEFGRWAGRPVEYVVDFSARDTWEEIAYPAYLVDVWRQVPARLVLGVAMLPREDEDATVEKGATGAFDGYYVELARGLVAAGRADTVIRLGWEFNLAESRWSTPDEQAWVTYWRRIVTAMRSVPGQRFVFDWNVDNGDSRYDAVDYYPGDRYVDVVGVDAYDVAGGVYPYPDECDDLCRALEQSKAWNEEIHGGERGLEFWARFARERGKALSVPEWGVWDRPDGTGGGDNGLYVRLMHAFVTDPDNNVLYHAYFEFDGDDGAHRLMTDAHPEAAAAFRKAFGPGR